jgi:hypothetical protein
LTQQQVRDGEARLLVALEGDSARQPYYREGNGLNVGLFGAVDIARMLPLLAHKGGWGGAWDDARVRVALEARERLGGAMQRLVVEDSMKLSVAEVLFNTYASIHRFVRLFCVYTRSLLTVPHMKLSVAEVLFNTYASIHR